MWVDMLLHHPEALDRLDRRIALVDWLYDRHAACGNAWFFGGGGGGAHTRVTIPQPLLERFGPFLYPQGEEQARFQAEPRAQSLPVTAYLKRIRVPLGSCIQMIWS